MPENGNVDSGLLLRMDQDDTWMHIFYETDLS